jgi:glycosyltransferase involved in cell wall biosynthesis
MKRLRVAYLVPSLNLGGSETLLLYFLQRLDRRRFEPEVHAFYPGDRLVGEFRDAGIRVTEWHAPRRDPFAFFRLCSALRRRRVDLVHTHLFDRQGRVAAWLAGVPVIVTTYHNVSDWDGAGLGGRLKVWIDTITARLDDRIIAVSDSVRECAVGRGRIPADRIVTVWNGIDVAAFASRPPAAAVVSELGLEERRVVVSIGRLVEEKGHLDLLEAADALRRDFPSLVVLIVGEGPMRGVLEAEVGRRRLEGFVRLTGGRRDIPEILSTAEIFAMPSRYEGLPITLLEAMASGKPIVAADVPGIRGIVRDGKDALLVPARDPSALAKALSTLLADRGAATKLGEAARRRAAGEFDIERHVRRVEEIYLAAAREKGCLD